jgi:hypothetical protein
MFISAARARSALDGFLALGVIILVGLTLTSSFVGSEIVRAHETPGMVRPFVSLSLNDGGGTVAADASGNGNTGTLLNGPSWTTGKSGGALSFDGIDDTVYIANSSTLNSATTGITVAAWVYRAANQSGGVAVISRELGTTFYEHFYFGFEDGKYRWFVNTASGYSDTTVGGQAPLGQWVYLVGTYDGTDVKLYANGNLQFSSPHSGALSGDITGITSGASHNDAAFAGRGLQRQGRRGEHLRPGADGVGTSSRISRRRDRRRPPSVAISTPATGGSVRERSRRRSPPRMTSGSLASSSS